GDPRQGLHVMAELVGEDVGLCEVAGRMELDRERPEEAGVQVDRVVERAVERAGGARGRPAAGHRRALEDDDCGRRVGTPAALELPRPEGLDVADDRLEERLETGADGSRRNGLSAAVGGAT